MLKVPVFGVILVRIFPHLDWIRRDTSLCIQSKCGKTRTRITPNTNTFYVRDPQHSHIFWIWEDVNLTILHDYLLDFWKRNGMAKPNSKEIYSLLFLIGMTSLWYPCSKASTILLISFALNRRSARNTLINIFSHI